MKKQALGIVSMNAYGLLPKHETGLPLPLCCTATVCTAMHFTHLLPFCMRLPAFGRWERSTPVKEGKDAREERLDALAVRRELAANTDTKRHVCLLACLLLLLLGGAWYPHSLPPPTHSSPLLHSLLHGFGCRATSGPPASLVFMVVLC